MKNTIQLAALVLTLSTINTQLSTALAQGSLTPPAGPPAPVMKSLDQIEARTPITNRTSLVTISEPGSYYLTGNLTVSTGNGINITTNNVMLDLNGYTIRSTAPTATGNGIDLGGFRRNLTIVNGFIQGGATNNGSGVFGGGGFVNGIMHSAGQPQNALVSHVSVSGCQNFGIFLAYDTTVAEACTVHTIANQGIVASLIRNCTASDCGNDAIVGQQVSDSRGESVSGNGIFAHTALNCYGSSANTGVKATTALNCYGFSSGTSPSSTGVSADVAQNCYGHCNTSGSGNALFAITANNCVAFRPTGPAIKATVANGCYALAGTNIITYKYNMP